MKAKPPFLAGVLAVTLAMAAGLPGRARPNDTADRAGKAPAQTETIDLGGGVTMEFVLIPAGSFVMGSPGETGEADEAPLHHVTLTQPFHLGKYEVTQEQWARLMGGNPSHFQGSRLPVDTVSWNDCQRFLGKLQAKTGRAFALPTEAQWEYACRADATTRWSFGDSPAPIGDYAWWEGNSRGTSHPVGGKNPNAWGLHDLHGNLGEWCADWYENRHPPGDDPDPRGPLTGASRVVRGGAWGDDPVNMRCASRNANGPDGANNGIGFRCVLLAAPLPPAAPLRAQTPPP